MNAGEGLLREALTLIERHHADQTEYSRSKKRAASTCAEFRPDSIRALIESAYMEGLGKNTADTVERIRTHLASLPADEGNGALWRSHDNTGMQYPEASDVSGGETDCIPPAPVTEAKEG